MRRTINRLAFLLIAATVICGVVVVDASADKLEQRDHSNAIIEETNFIIDQFDDVAILYEDPLESEKIDAALDWHYIEGCTLTAYCACSECCGEWADGITASGATAQEGVTVAVDPDVIPLGAWVEIDGHQYHAEDTGGFCGNHVDIYFESHDEALQFGVRNESVRWYFG